MTNTPLYILAPFVPTPQDVVERMLELAGVTDKDTVYDLGCGDGRIVITAAKKYGAKGVGFDIEPYRVEESQANARLAGVEQLTTFKLQDAMTVDVSEATVVTLYLVHWSTSKIQSVITKDARQGTRVVSHGFGIDGCTPAKVEKFIDMNGESRTIYLWVTDNG